MKKGITPLIATVLLVGFTVALAVIIFNWGVDFVKNAQDNVDKTTESSLLCSNKLDFTIKEVKCKVGGEQKVVIENNGEIDIINLTLRVHAGEKITPVSFSDGIPAFGLNTFDLTAQALMLGNEVDAIATIKGSDGGKVICNQAMKSRKYECEVPAP